MFTQDCYIKKNTPELREYLESIGYGICTCTHDDLGWLFTYKGEVHSVDTEEQIPFRNDILDGRSDNIECENEAQFKAIAALRDDADKNQWFTNGRNGWYITCHDIIPKTIKELFHKATVEELIEHFKNNN